MTKKKKVKPMVSWSCYIQCWAYSFKVRARTEGEARKKMFERCKKIPISKIVNKKNSYVDKMYGYDRKYRDNKKESK